MHDPNVGQLVFEFEPHEVEVENDPTREVVTVKIEARFSHEALKLMATRDDAAIAFAKAFAHNVLPRIL